MAVACTCRSGVYQKLLLNWEFLAQISDKMPFAAIKLALLNLQTLPLTKIFFISMLLIMRKEFMAVYHKNS